MDDKIEKLERDLRRLKLYAFLLTAALMWLVLAGFQSKPDNHGILRTRGLIIEDQTGRERILLGAPIPPATNRVRTDLTRVKEIWAKRFPKEYMKWYQAYRHDMNGLLILDEKGFDRVAVGDPVPDPNIGKRIAPSTGIEINDEQGFERSGYGLLKVQDRYRVVLGLDSAKGTEGLTLALFDDGPIGLGVHDSDRTLYLGTAPPESPLTKISEPFHGLLLRNGAEVKYEVNAARGK